MGAHPSASSVLLDQSQEINLNQLIKEDPANTINQQVFDRFGELPYLFKVLDVKDMLSIQVHPTKAEAEKGFDAEEAAGIPISAPHRNYKDRNHKPEVMVALSDFWLLHGFRSAESLNKILEDVPEFNILIALYRRDGAQALYRFVMEMAQADINNMLLPLVKRELRRKQDGELDRSMPGWWVSKLFEGQTEIGDIDRGVFSIYFFNIVYIEKGGAIFQSAGIPHAYLEGQNMELMANSDNVLRGGLTPKHIDVPELMKHTSCDPVIPNVMKGNDLKNGEIVYPCPVPDFGISRLELNGAGYSSTAVSLEILFVTEGGCVINNEMPLKTGEAAAVLAGGQYTIESSGPCTIFKAFVPQG
jgi:mannose-6-phosphate isomerase